MIEAEVVAGKSSWDVVVPAPTSDELELLWALYSGGTLVGAVYVGPRWPVMLFRWRGRYGMAQCPFCPRVVTVAGAGRARHIATHEAKRMEALREAFGDLDRRLPCDTLATVNEALAFFGLGPLLVVT